MKSKKEILEKFRLKWGYKIDKSIREGYEDVIEDISKDNLKKICKIFIDRKKSGDRKYFPKPIDFEKANDKLTDKNKIREIETQQNDVCKACNNLGLIPIMFKRTGRTATNATISVVYFS